MIPSTSDIWERFSEELHRFIARRVENPLDADDLLQDTFIKIHTRIDTLQDEERMAGWIYSVARNTINDYYRTRRVQFEISDDLVAGDEADDDNPEIELAMGLKAMIDDLPDKYRRPLELYELKGMKQSEIALLMGLSLSGAKSRLQRGREQLRQNLLDCCHFEFDRRGRIIDYLPKQQCCTRCNC
jgi:RNA polymerase sigma-70 factor, ECF subfamily